jgi:hypothetical protein
MSLYNAAGRDPPQKTKQGERTRCKSQLPSKWSRWMGCLGAGITMHQYLMGCLAAKAVIPIYSGKTTIQAIHGQVCSFFLHIG